MKLHPQVATPSQKLGTFSSQAPILKNSAVPFKEIYFYKVKNEITIFLLVKHASKKIPAKFLTYFLAGGIQDKLKCLAQSSLT